MSFKFRNLYLPYLSYSKPFCIQNRSACFGEQRNIFILLEIETHLLGISANLLVTTYHLLVEVVVVVVIQGI